MTEPITSTTRARRLEQIQHDLWQQFPTWPSTWSGCYNDDCPERARGGRLCRKCLQTELAGLVGPNLARMYVEAIGGVRALESGMRETVENTI